MQGKAILHRSVGRSGQPVIALAVLLAVWILYRALSWTSPFQTPAGEALGEGVVPSVPIVSVSSKEHLSDEQAGLVQAAPISFAVAGPEPLPIAFRPYRSERGQTPAGLSAVPDRRGGHQILLMAALSHTRMSDRVNRWTRLFSTVSPVRQTAVQTRRNPSQRSIAGPWSFDGWMLLRANGGPVAGLATLPPSYGASQTGAVMRYRLDDDSSHKPAAYVRVTKSLDGPSQGDVAAGLSARPARRVPARAMAELRVSRFGARNSVRPAVLAVSELPPVNLPFDMRAEIYLQAGYVGGDFATGFIDGQARVDRELARFDLGQIRTGGGVWGGAQEGAERLDIGPSASFETRIADKPVRIAMDYRHRVMGDALPASGITLTVSTGF